MKKVLYALVLLCSLCVFSSSFAEDALVVNYDEINKDLVKTESNLLSGKITIDDTVEYIKSLNKTQNNVREIKKQDEQELSVVQKRIEALGEAPKDGEKEIKEISQKRAEFGSEITRLRAKIAEGDLIITKIDEIESLILSIRNKDLLVNILNKQDMFLHPGQVWNAAVNLADFMYEIVKSPANWYKNLNQEEKNEVRENILYVTLIMGVSLIIGIYLSIFIRRKFGYRENIDNLDYIKKVFAAVWTFIAYGVIPAAIIGGFLLWLKNTAVIDKDFFSLILQNIALYLLYIFLCLAVVKVVFVPQNGKWRLFEVGDKKAVLLSRALFASIVSIGLVSWLETVAAESHATSEVIYLIKMISNVVKMLCIVLLSKRALYNTEALTDDELIKDESSDDESIGKLSVSSKISLLISFSAIGVFCLSLFGYITMSEYIFDRFIISILVLGSFYIVNKAINVIVHRILQMRFWIRNLRIGRKSLIKIDFWFGFILTPVLFAVAALSLLSLWGVSVDILMQNVKKFLTEFYIGGVRISIVSIALGVFVFFISLTVFKALKRSLLTGVLASIEMDDGVRGSLAAGFGFVGFIVSIVLAIAVMGGNLTNLALIAGALSFGVGLGLQNIVSNFVSGIIILFERPMKIGDWVIINGQEGIVQQINIRGTEIETFDKSTVIIPNATILSSSLTNLTHHSKLGRVKVSVGVSYASDTNKVRDILIGIAKSHKEVLHNPEPSIVLTNFGDNSLDYELRCFAGDINNKSTIQDDIRETIVTKFREAGIDIPFPQRVVHSVGGNLTEEQLAQASD
ncbi:MAG: mechanosensitive ion channel [Lactobacillaceae bacterium]|nr:mechanosensitive ion channel [Lactobacillaceae bacterium]